MRSKATIRIFFVLVILFGSSRPGYTTSRQALVILANFQDAESNISREQYDDLFNAETYDGQNASVSVRKYVQEVSRGALELQFTVTDWLTLPHSASHYVGMDAGAIRDAASQALVKDAVAVLDQAGFDFSPYDSDGDGWADLIGIVHRGSNPASGTGQAPDWSCVPNLIPPIAVDDIQIRRAWMITDSNPAFGTITTIGGIIHEMLGHAVCNLPDLYDWLPGSWEQIYGGNTFRPTHISAYAKQQCGWVEIVDIDQAGPLQILPIEEVGIAYRLWIDPYRESEYFLLEYRELVGLDQNLPGSGLLVWHVDLLADQSNFLYLEQADGRNDLAQTFGFGAADQGDPFPGSTGNRFFTGDSVPNTDARGGRKTGIRVENISLDMEQNTIHAEVTPSPDLKGITLIYDETYPQFAWDWQPPGGHQVGEHVAVRFTTLKAGSIQLIKIKYWGPPPSDAFPKPFEIKIYEGFEEGNILTAQPMRTLTGQLLALVGENNWYSIELASSIPVTAGSSFVVDFKWAEPVITIDYTGLSDGRSYYRPPGTDSYTALPHDLRIRAVIAFDIVGDLNSNKAIDLGDVVLALQVIGGKSPSSSLVVKHDIDGDGRVGLPEAIFILQILAELRTKVLNY